MKLLRCIFVCALFLACSQSQVVETPQATPEFSLRVMPPHDSNIRGRSVYPLLLSKRIDQSTGLFLQSAIERIPTGQVKILALLVEFSDNIHSVQASYFDSLIFDFDGNSVRNYYSEVSYGQVDLVTVNIPSSLGWLTAPQSYSYYVDSNYGTGRYPQNTQKLTEDLVDAVDGVVDFSQYDNDSNGTVDIVMIVHSGRGAELTGSNSDIWSHKWSIIPRLKDGVTISNFTVQPEYWQIAGDMTIGVYAHELGHGFGLPDLYDIDGSSNGIGRWCLMSYGSWNGRTGLGDYPAYPDVWARHLLGVTIPTVMSTTTLGLIIPPINYNSVSYKVVNPANPKEYFIFENRLKVGYEQYAITGGLYIWHIHDEVFNNNNEWYPSLDSTYHLHVAIEQSDGLYEIEKRISNGNVGDIWPTSTKTTFSPTTSPSSNWYKSQSNFSLANIRKVGNDIVLDVLIGDSVPPSIIEDSLFAPYALTAFYNSLNNSVQLNWQDSSTNVDMVYIERQDKRQKGGWGNYVLIDSTQGIDFINTALPQVQQVKYRIRQRLGLEISLYSNEAKTFLK